ncbi:hypothetical protein GCM10011349_19820 [Novosphingobium indicum]|uniref:Phage tail protein n=1 Tax=Novosphingobium indicum TaxID=462949 RepID=A0ABQ2JP12_9SPHN|nr:hypothetical protein [Novosphingobium indicum]GGN49306.1 hypothetical protein GCM10011349_19820 [Novosphingobium indicum]
MAFAKRKISLQFMLGQGDFGESGSDTVTLENLRCSVNIVRAGIGYSQADITVYGMTLDLMNKLTVTQKFFFEQRRYNQVIVSAGDEDSGMAMCFGGAIMEAWADGRQAPDVAFYVSAQSGAFELMKPVPPVSFKGSVDAALVLSGIAEQMGYSFENGGISAVLNDPYKPGTPKAQIASICRDIDCQSDIDDSTRVVAVWPKDKARGSQAIRIAPDSGLIGYPSFTQGGIQFSCLYNPNLVFGAPVKLESQFAAASGQWKVYQLAHRLESNVPGGLWSTDVECTYLDQQA